jgi:hypothetical protein
METSMTHAHVHIGLVALLGVAVVCCKPVSAAPSITLTEVEVESREIVRGDTFTLRAAAVGQGAEVRSYRVRTPYPVDASELPPGFYLDGGCAVLKADGGALFDNGKFDLDPAPGVIGVKVSTKNLPEGTHYLVVFAHNRPGDGVHVMDYRNLRLEVAEHTVQVSVLDRSVAPRAPVEFLLPDPIPKPGAPLVCGAKLKQGTAGALGLRLRPPYTWGESEVLPGFRYYPDEKVAYLEDDAGHAAADGGPLDADPAAGSIRVEVPTRNWPPGLHFLSMEATGLQRVRAPYGAVAEAYRDFAVKVPDPRDRLIVDVEPSVCLAEGTHFSALASLGNGVVLNDDYRSEDGGRTWTKLAKSMPRPNVLSDGSVLAMAYRALPIEGEKGVYAGQLFVSKDGGVTVEGPLPSRVVVPKARAALGHGPHVGPLFGRSLVELGDGSLVSAMYGWFEGDTEPDHYRAGGTMRRSYVCRSPDRGRSWEYLSTVAYEPFLGNEGYSELVIRRLPNDELLALVRTGGNSNPGRQDNPLMTSRSADGGRTWSPVERTGVEGVWPDLCIMSDGTFACSTGRPGAFVMFSTDNGRTWADVTAVDAERYSGYTALCEVAPGELLVGYGAQNWCDPATGERSDQLRLVRLKVRRR